MIESYLRPSSCSVADTHQFQIGLHDDRPQRDTITIFRNPFILSRCMTPCAVDADVFSSQLEGGFIMVKGCLIPTDRVWQAAQSVPSWPVCESSFTWQL